MEGFIKYERRVKLISIENGIDETALQKFYDEIILNGFEIIYYNEDEHVENNTKTDEILHYLHITVLLGKRKQKI